MALTDCPPTNLSQKSVNGTTNSVFESHIGLLTMLVIAATLFVTTVGVAFDYYRLRQKYNKEKERQQNKNKSSKVPCSEEYFLWLEKHLPSTLLDTFSKVDIKEKRAIGFGNFGIVHYGKLENENEVAVKEPADGENNFKSVVNELRILSHLDTHTNIVGLFGIHTGESCPGKIYIVMEYYGGGSLLSFLRTCQREQVSSGMPCGDVYQLCRFSLEIACAMEHISRMGIIHRDIYVLLTYDYVCKMGDFGLSRKLEAGEEYLGNENEPTPWRWTAPESLKSRVYSVKSDVWSYGITLWEIFSLGVNPYPGLPYTPTFYEMLENGFGMRVAEYANGEIHDQLLNCWNIVPEERPIFFYLQEYFKAHL